MIERLWGRQHRSARLKFETHTTGRKVDGVRAMFRHWKVYSIDGIWGFAIGSAEHRWFVGLLKMKEVAGEQERIK